MRLLEAALSDRHPLFVKIGRYDEDKRWTQAIEAFALVRLRHAQATLVIRGGSEPYGERCLAHASALGLNVEDVRAASPETEAFARALSAASGERFSICGRSFPKERFSRSIGWPMPCLPIAVKSRSAWSDSR